VTATAPTVVDRTMRDALPLLVGVGLLMAGNGLTTTLLGIRAGLEGFDTTVIGIVLAGYYAGFLAGSLVTPSTIARVGHVRVFAGLASLASVAVLLHVVRPAPVTWLLLRGLAGLCISGLYVVTETWLNGAATNRSRGSLLAVYMVVVTGSLGLGQVLFSVADPGGYAAFVLASVLVSLAVVPVCLATVRVPAVPDPQPLSMRALVEVAPLAPVGAALSGFTSAAMIGAGTVYAAEAGLGQAATSALLAAALLGGLALQVPLGRWSDRTDRRRVILLAGGIGAVAACAAAAIGPDHLLPLVAVTLVAGGTPFPLYSLASAHLNDYLDAGRVVAAGARLVLVNGAGAVAGPIVGAAAMAATGPGALFVVLAVAYVAVGGYAAWRITRRAAVPEEERAPYVAVPTGTTPAVATLQQVVPEELYPFDDGEVEVDGRRVGYREQGQGEPLVVLPHAGDGDGRWRRFVGALASDGVRAVARAPGQRPSATVEQRVEDVLAVLRHLELPQASFVGWGSGVEVVQRLAADHPDRVASAVVVGPATVPDDLVERGVLSVGDVGLLRADPEGFADLVVALLRQESGVRPA